MRWKKYVEVAVISLVTLWIVKADPLNLGIAEKLGI